jgi:hypothetical protein
VLLTKSLSNSCAPTPGSPSPTFRAPHYTPLNLPGCDDGWGGHLARADFEGEFMAADANVVTIGQRRAGANPLLRYIDSVG